MRRSGKLSRLERGLAVGLALVWLIAGSVALYVALAGARWGPAALAVVALVYGVAWLRVALRSRLLTWQEFVAPWRRAQPRTE